MSDVAPPSTTPHESDIAYLKRLAIAGRGEPAPFLMLMAVFGGAYGLSLLILTAGLLSEAAAGPSAGGYAPGPITVFVNQWLLPIDHLIFLSALIWTGWRTLGPKRARLNRAATATWTAAFIGLVTVSVMMWGFARSEPHSGLVQSAQLLPSILLVLWGCAWWVTAITNDRPWLLSVAAGSHVAAVGLAVAEGTLIELPIICACLLLLALLPAVVLMRERRG